MGGIGNTFRKAIEAVQFILVGGLIVGRGSLKLSIRETDRLKPAPVAGHNGAASTYKAREDKGDKRENENVICFSKLTIRSLVPSPPTTLAAI
ncbi:hypothetical protein GWI33_008484 [Rhynchophorus ferrugineus]|uniref:Uncharacterized protein n=1 Tax=Rhynchophorus ferrugineus TaxID=354439 RepID=A0A834MB09_RHYFE|nr:hypothetical protein GWI33_008484 [Rhynchophorus ferrugineus]